MVDLLDAAGNATLNWWDDDLSWWGKVPLVGRQPRVLPKEAERCVIATEEEFERKVLRRKRGKTVTKPEFLSARRELEALLASSPVPIEPGTESAPRQMLCTFGDKMTRQKANRHATDVHRREMYRWTVQELKRVKTIIRSESSAHTK